VIWLALAFVLGAALVVAVLTVDRWLGWLLNALDGLLTRIRFGKWSARMLTAAEDWVRRKWGRRAEGGDGDGGQGL
jgi:hypothetical protein